MLRYGTWILLLVFRLAVCSFAQDTTAALQTADTPVLMNEEQFTWSLQPDGVKIAVLKGDPFKKGTFIQRMILPTKWKVDPHWHAATEVVFIIKGAIYEGIGNTFKRAGATKVGEGGFIVMPAKTVHYAYTENEAVVQVEGVGPATRTFVSEKTKQE